MSHPFFHFLVNTMAHIDRAYLRAVREFHPQGTIAHTPIECIKFCEETSQNPVCSFLTPQPNAKPLKSRLTRFGGDLGGRALSTLLALDALTSGLSGVLGLVGLLSLLGSSLLLLGILDGLLAGSGTGLGALVAALLDHIEGSTNDGTLGLDGTAGTLLSDFLFAFEKSPVSNSLLGPRCIELQISQLFQVMSMSSSSVCPYPNTGPNLMSRPIRKTKEITSNMGKNWRY
jgi:hypothetical protein